MGKSNLASIVNQRVGRARGGVRLGRQPAIRCQFFGGASCAVHFSVSLGDVGCPDVSTPSPGPGWWLASDGKWYPQQWESTFVAYTNESLQAVLEEANRLTQAYGEQGWEIVGSSVQRTQVAHRFKDYDKGGDHYFEWSIVCTLKRPVAPA